MELVVAEKPEGRYAELLKRLFLSFLLTALLGVLLGYLGAYVEYANERDHGASYSQWKHEWLCLPALPGEVIVTKQNGYDYCLTEAWLVDRHRIAFWNGVFFLPLGPLAGLVRRKKP
jgi:hypothetical protein